MASLVAAFGFFALFALSSGQNTPTYGNVYIIHGTLSLPYAEIVEPIIAYYEAPKGRSRVDYYTGVQISISKSNAPGYPYGTSYKAVYYTDQTVLNRRSCFQANGTKGATVPITQAIPDLTGLKFIGTSIMRNIGCNTFQMVETKGKKVNTYTFYSEISTNKPVRYEMMGYDTLFGSHYDKYYIDYTSYSNLTSIPDSVFEVPFNLTCTSFPGPGMSAEERIQMDPIREYVHHENKHVDEAFGTFKKVHKRQYKAGEHDSRKDTFMHNLRFIHSKNRAGLSYTVKVNHLADHTKNEMKRMRGFRYTAGGVHSTVPFKMEDMKVKDPPTQWDWRLIGAVTPVKDQAVCGSCWSFGTTGTIEGANFLKHGQLIRLSQQELMDCSWGYGNNACDGGEDFRAYQWMMANGGITSEDQYGQYLAIDGFCKNQTVKPVVQISGYTTLPSGNLWALKTAIFNNGPISVAIDASHPSLSFYANGVYYEPACKSDPDSLDHAVLAVGYGQLNGQDYWLVKNSWSTYWGNDGYVLMAQKNNNCGVATDATYVHVV